MMRIEGDNVWELLHQLCDLLPPEMTPAEAEDFDRLTDAALELAATETLIEFYQYLQQEEGS